MWTMICCKNYKSNRFLLYENLSNIYYLAVNLTFTTHHMGNIWTNLNNFILKKLFFKVNLPTFNIIIYYDTGFVVQNVVVFRDHECIIYAYDKLLCKKVSVNIIISV